jgi:hypothetical protein
MIPPGSMSNLCSPAEFCFVKINWTLTSDDESAGGLAAPAGIPLVPELTAGNQLASFFQFQFTYQGGSLPGPFSIGPSSVMVTSDVETVTPPVPEPNTLLLLVSGWRVWVRGDGRCSNASRDGFRAKASRTGRWQIPACFTHRV